MKKISIIILSLFILITLILVLRANKTDINKGGIYVCSEESKICADGSVVSRTGPNCEFAVCPQINNSLTEIEARTIAEKSCIKGGEVLSFGTYNINSKTWWYDANLNGRPEGCNPACVVSEETKTAEINWRCTGLKQPIACTMDAKQCPDGSYVGRTGPNCEFICPQ